MNYLLRPIRDTDKGLIAALLKSVNAGIQVFNADVKRKRDFRLN